MTMTLVQVDQAISNDGHCVAWSKEPIKVDSTTCTRNLAAEEGAAGLKSSLATQAEPMTFGKLLRNILPVLTFLVAILFHESLEGIITGVQVRI